MLEFLGVVRVNYETGAGSAFKIYGGSSSSLYASFNGNHFDPVSGTGRWERTEIAFR